MSDINEMNVGLRWYVAHTYSGYENKVKANLEKIIENRGLGDKIFDIRIPLDFTLSNKEIKKELDRIIAREKKGKYYTVITFDRAFI